MQDYYHCVPGRMRVKIRALKHQPDRGGKVQRLLQGLDGVDAVTFTALTGSLVILFDPGRTGPAQICECLSNRGLLDPALATSSDDHIQGAVAQAGVRLGKAFMGWALGKTLQASGLHLLAALI